VSTTTTQGQQTTAPQRAERTVGVAMIGGGMMAKSHTMAFRNLRAVYGSVPLQPRLAVLCDSTPELASAGARALGYERWTTDWRSVLDDPEVDIVDIVTPNHLHKEMALAAAAAGKHIYCEKPLALTAEDALEMTEAAERARVTTIVGFSYLRNPAIALARKLVAEGKLGEITAFTGAFAISAMCDPQTPFTWRQDRALAGSGALGDLGAHVIALARTLVGDITRVASLASTVVKQRPQTRGTFGYGAAAAADLPLRTVENDDIMLFLCDFANGAVGSIEASRVATGRAYDLSFTLTGTQGAVRFDQQHMHRLEVALASDPPELAGFRVVDTGPAHGDYGVLWPVPGINIGVHDLKLFEAYDFLAALAEGRSAWPDFREGYEVQRVIEAVDRASRNRRWEDVG
jgi:predicted dehydrogenase